MKSYSSIVSKKIASYNPKGDLAHTAKFFLALCSVNHTSTREHVERVSLLAEAAAKILKKDMKAAFFAGLLHDVGKMLLPADLFDGHNVNAEEYAHIKSHAQAGFIALKKFHLFTALCAGLHHNLYKGGYGACMDAFPSDWSPATIKKVLEISTIISICDFVDAYTHRKTVIKDGSDTTTGEAAPTLESMLCSKYPDDISVVDAVLSIHGKYL